MGAAVCPQRTRDRSSSTSVKSLRCRRGCWSCVASWRSAAAAPKRRPVRPVPTAASRWQNWRPELCRSPRPAPQPPSQQHRWWWCHSRDHSQRRRRAQAGGGRRNGCSRPVWRIQRSAADTRGRYLTVEGKKARLMVTTLASAGFFGRGDSVADPVDFCPDPT